MFKKRKEKLYSDISTVEYWKNRIKPGMKLNNSEVHRNGYRYRNFIVPKTFDIVIRAYKELTSLSIRHIGVNGETNWFDIYVDGVSVEIVQEDIMSPMTNPCAEIKLNF